MTDDRKYRTEVPNIIDDLGLDPYERTLYVHYKRVCGASGGQCTEGVRTIASRTKMSVGKITKARKTLFARGLIGGDVQHGKDSAVTVIDIWDINTAYYADKNRPSVDGWGVAELRQWVNHCSPGEQLNGSSQDLPGNSSLPEQNCSYSEQNCSPGEQKKEPLKNEPIKKISPNGDSGNEPPQPDLIPEGEVAPEENLLPDTPQTLYLFEKINHNRKLKNRGPMKEFKSSEQKQKCLAAMGRLPPKELEKSVTKGLEKGLTDIASLINWIARWELPKNGTYENGRKTTQPNRGGNAYGPPASRTGPPGTPVSATGLGEWTEDEKREYGFS